VIPSKFFEIGEVVYTHTKRSQAAMFCKALGLVYGASLSYLHMKATFTGFIHAFRKRWFEK
jgi:hypothetical protein